MAGIFHMLEDPKGQARFCFAHVGTDFSTGVLVLKPDTELPKHNRPQAEENLLQIVGRSQVSLLSESGEIEATYELTPGTSVHMKKGQWHIHANPFGEPSVTQFYADGDITGIVEDMRQTYAAIEPDGASTQI
jgi:quercetin dioxygenase-like cupin family protein